jgi:hypothetical protein
MKRYVMVSVAVVACMAATAVLHGLAVRADDAPPMTEAHIERIRNNCVEAQSTLSQLHASDALLRVNRGQLYESLSVKLMAPFNSRLSLNRLDGTQLVATATAYDNQLANFREKYQAYEEAMSKALRINCKNEPVSFYDSVADARAKRKAVHLSTLGLHETIKRYKKDFNAFAKAFKEKSE